MMRLRAGDMNREVTIQRRTSAQEPVFGTNMPGWAHFATVAAQVQDVLPSRAMEGEESGMLMSRRRARVRMWWIDGLDSSMRLLCEGRTLQIVGEPAELGLRTGWEILAEEYSTEGDSP